MQKKEDKKYNDFEKSYPKQLEFFSLKNVYSVKKDKYSSTADLYDIMPKYFHGDVEKIRHNGKYIDVLTRNFVYQNQKMILNITPAKLLLANGTSKDFLPSIREEIIEDVLRKFAINPNKHEFLDNRLTVKFTLYELWKELRNIGHAYDYNHVKESLLILAKTNVEVITEDKSITFSGNMFETFGIVNENANDNIEKILDENSDNYNKKIIYFVRFNSLVSKSIENKTWRILNYEQCMSYKKVVSRWLHKRISHMFLTRKVEIPFNILLSTIIRDSGMANYKELRYALSHIKLCLEEMLKIGSIKEYKMEYIYSKERKNKIEDVKFLIYVSDSFWDDLKLNFYIYNECDTVQSNKLNTVDNYNDIITDITTTTCDNKQQNKTEIETKKNTLKEKIKKMLQSVSIQDKDIKKIISTTSEKKLVKIKDNVQAGINYINRQLDMGNNCNNLAIIISAINNDWNVEQNDRNIKEEDKVVITKKEIQNEITGILKNIEHKKFKQIINKIIDYFGLTVYKAYFHYIDFISIKDNALNLSINNNYALDIINREYLNGIQKLTETGEKFWYKKGIKELVKEILPQIEIINFFTTKT